MRPQAMQMQVIRPETSKADPKEIVK